MVWHKLRNYFVSGLLVLGPLYLSLLFLVYLLRLADNILVDPLFGVLPFQIDARYKVFLTKAAIVIIVFLFISFIGLLARKFLLKNVLEGGEALLKSIPLVSQIYSSIKEVVHAFLGEKRGIFKRVVFVEYPRKGIFAMGFVMNEERWEIHEKTGKDSINVFVPSPPNPATGFHVFIPKEDVVYSDMSIEDGIRLVISGGGVVPPLKKIAG
jgi:uncharacterized membrane protein